MYLTGGDLLPASTQDRNSDELAMLLQLQNFPARPTASAESSYTPIQDDIAETREVPTIPQLTCVIAADTLTPVIAADTLTPVITPHIPVICNPVRVVRLMRHRRTPQVTGEQVTFAQSVRDSSSSSNNTTPVSPGPGPDRKRRTLLTARHGV